MTKRRILIEPLKFLMILIISSACSLFTSCEDDPSSGATMEVNVDQGPVDSERGDTSSLGDMDTLSLDMRTHLVDMGAMVEDMSRPDLGEEPPRPDIPSFAINWPIFERPTDPLAGTPVESCPIFQESACIQGTRRVCDIYDTARQQFNDEPEAMLRRAYLYDRWYDLYASPQGQTMERRFNESMMPGTPEEVWTDPAYFAEWRGAGDSAIWTGTALNGLILRYLHTGTEADYHRMEEKTRVMVRFFEVTQIPGYLARYHYLLVPPETPNTPEYVLRYTPNNDDHRDIEDPDRLTFLPELYRSGLGTPRWSGDPSIDQMNGPMVAFPMVYGLLRDEGLKEQIVYQMTCYLHRLKRIEVINLQQNPDVLSAFREYFGGGELDLDEGDLDFNALDRVVMYVHPQINTQNEDTYDKTCGEFIQMEPWRVLDASSPTFVIDMINLAQDISREENRPNHINHFYIPSLRGGDAVHMMHLSLMAYAFTGDERYAEFLREELLGNLRTAEVAKTMSALIPPPYCRKFYGTNIIAGPMWSFNNLLADSERDVLMQEAMRDEMWEKECSNLGNVNFNLMFAGAVSPEIGGDARQLALNYAVETLPVFGGNGGILDDPRRTYDRSYAEVVSQMPEGIVPQCATEEQRFFCERDINVFGFALPGQRISFECTGDASECVMEDGLCTHSVASGPLPPAIRRWGDYTWQRSPFAIGESRDQAKTQSPGNDYTEQYWMARFYDFVEGSREVLAWRDTAEVCE